MRHFRIISLVAFLFGSLESLCQSSEKVEMADILRENGKIYTVVAGVVVILSAMIILLVWIDRRIFKLEKQLKKTDTNPDKI